MAAAGVGAQKNLGECAGADGKPKSTLYPAEQPGFAACVTLCVLSHPAVGELSSEIYFPCMGASLAAFAVCSTLSSASAAENERACVPHARKP